METPTCLGYVIVALLVLLLVYCLMTCPMSGGGVASYTTIPTYWTKRGDPPWH
jgi:hypothetical protein